MTQNIYPVNNGYLPLRSTLPCRIKVRANLSKTWQNLGLLVQMGGLQTCETPLIFVSLPYGCYLCYLCYLPKILQNAIDTNGTQTVYSSAKARFRRTLQPWERFIYQYSSLPKYVFIQSCINEHCRKKKYHRKTLCTFPL